MPMVYLWCNVVVRVAPEVFLAALVVASTSIGKVAIDLFNSKVTQLLVSEKVLPYGRRVIHLVGVLWVFL